MTAMVEAQRIHKRFGKLEVLKGISLRVPVGGVVVVIGPSGSGKSTFLRCVNHLESIDAGRLYVDGMLVGYKQKGDRLSRTQGPRSLHPTLEDRDGLPIVQPLPAHDCHGEHHRGAHQGQGRDQGRRRRSMRRSSWRSVGLPGQGGLLPAATLRADNNSASRSRALWP